MEPAFQILLSSASSSQDRSVGSAQLSVVGSQLLVVSAEDRSPQQHTAYANTPVRFTSAPSERSRTITTTTTRTRTIVPSGRTKLRIVAWEDQSSAREDRSQHQHTAYADTPTRFSSHGFWTLAATFSRRAFKAMKPVASDWL
jgi:hypothetical protein